MMPTERPVPPAPRNARSSTTIRRTPSPARWKATETPVTPPPTISASAVRTVRGAALRARRGRRRGHEAHGVAGPDGAGLEHARVDAAVAGVALLRHAREVPALEGGRDVHARGGVARHLDHD